MKILLTLFLLFFSSSVFAKDDLTGKSIVCGKINDDYEPKVEGFDFISNQNVNHFFYSKAYEKFKLANTYFARTYKYKTSYSKIKISWTNFKTYYEIARNNLDLKWKSSQSDNLKYKGMECSTFINESILDNLENSFDKIVDEITKDNKL